MNDLRSPGSADPHSSAKYVMPHTAESGPPGAPLRAKHANEKPAKTTRTKSDGNRGGVGRAARSKNRMHGGGQISAEEKARRAAQAAEHYAKRASS